ncbi:hypothetical protein MS3_00000709 [Schistosoma haematobium]|uniref:Uncharacterized protein n=1 Tax=Schistosoma haematobium TaxID=6185 RepID=A0A922IJJ5_SCHHA|nr:hypothetical protein MS3_00000709 [Schistosoma haematobium]KAH9580640.1 hypothetical protein MS3_00000709 [Schistosoma haematobium]
MSRLKLDHYGKPGSTGRPFRPIGITTISTKPASDTNINFIKTLKTGQFKDRKYLRSKSYRSNQNIAFNRLLHSIPWITDVLTHRIKYDIEVIETKQIIYTNYMSEQEQPEPKV